MPHLLIKQASARTSIKFNQGLDSHCQKQATYQFCTVEYLISASLAADSSTTAACSWFSSYAGAVHPSRYDT